MAMCGRYTLKSPPAEVGAEFDVDVRNDFPPRFNVCPTQPVSVVYQNERNSRQYGLMRWGVIPSWAKGEFLDNLARKPLINARSETVLEKASFRSAFKRRRCLVPADGFYEWKKQKDGPKQPYIFQRNEGAVFGLAGIWETAQDPDGGEIDTLAILTVASGPDLKSIHGREPVVIDREHYALWLEADERDLKELNPLLRAADKGTWSGFAVSTAVNSPRNDGPELIEPLEAKLL
ncbi:SOS response-associated peptidase [Hyphococcus formosus]|uniref:SOS response-associated peptidase n=1 Tax=Hyphococcus formosus TaxID=3143534 RepID=UPI00398B6C95